MQLDDLPESTQDYLKVLWNFEERSGRGAAMPLGELAHAAGQKLPTTSQAIKRLVDKGLVRHERYEGASLTDVGRDLAVGMVRRHRLLEAFLVSILGYTWDEVHEEADILEHASTDRFISRIEGLLGYPTRDPHGDPIPADDGTAEPLSPRRLADAPVDDPVIMEQVNDADPELLRFLQAHGIRPGVTLKIVAPPAAGLLHVSVDGEPPVPIAAVAAREIAVRVD